MNHSRRIDDRRRRVMMSSGSASIAAPTASSRKRIEELREARRPSMAYGSKVRRCLRGRWFSLVPVSRSASTKVFMTLAVAVAVLVLMHDASVRYVAIADRPTWIDVLRINRYGSLGRYVTGLLYLAVAGAAWMVYQLRRYRNDDFSGNYRLWQWIVITALIASFANTVPLIEMLGVGIEWGLGKRVALSGEDWIELFLMVGGAILALRTVAEMWRYRVATSLMLVGWVCMALPIAAEWNLLTINDLNRWTLVTSAPLIAVSFWFSATVGYLRRLFCEVRGIESAPGLMQRMRTTAEGWNTSTAPEGMASEGKETSSPSVVVAATRNNAQPVASERASSRPEPTLTRSRSERKATARTFSGSARDDSSEDANAKSSRWWPWGRKKTKDINPKQPGRGQEDDKPVTKPTANDSTTTQTKIVAKESANGPERETETPKTKRRWWPSFKRKPKPESTTGLDAEESDTTESGETEPATNTGTPDEPAKKRRFGLGSMMKRRGSEPAESSQAADKSDADNGSNRNHSVRHDTEGRRNANNDAPAVDDEVDWSSMNKAERRRMRKQLKRGGKAA